MEETTDFNRGVPPGNPSRQDGITYTSLEPSQRKLGTKQANHSSKETNKNKNGSQYQKAASALC